jgi:uncharacterized protein (DUF1800 family)
MNLKAMRWSLALVAAFAATTASAGDHVFDATFSERPEGPHSDAQAARFLTQASFGPTEAEIARLRALGYHAWLDEQFDLPATRHLPYLMTLEDAGVDVYQIHREEAWWLHSLTAPDQLRQRVAFALSELLVISDQNGDVGSTPKGMANYYDMLLDGAFGNYRELLEEATLSPIMGVYLSMFKNRKPDDVLNIRPDENYAREIMQLFSIGLVQLAPDGTPVLVGGQPVPTYDQDTIRGFAHVFTGWNWANCPRTDGGQWWEWEWCPIGPVPWPEPGWDVGWVLPMQAWDSYHASEGDKQLLVYPGVALDEGILPAGGTAHSDLQAALDNLFAHPNVAPFIARHLIKRLVTSNPSPAYVGRVAAAFADNGLGTRGDMGATVTAVLLDPEARTVPSLAGNGGKLREPLLRVAHLWRLLDARADDGRFREWNIEYRLGQAPLRSPTVFNFFLPDYRPPGELSDLGLDAPEFQITTDTFVASVANDLGGRVFWRWRGMPGQNPEDIVVDLAPELPFAADPVRLVDRYDLLFMNRTMSDFMFDTLVDYLQGLDDDNEGLRARVQNAVWLIQSSPEYAIER